MAWLPFTITPGRPSRGELLVLVGGLLLLASAVGGLVWWRRAMAPPPPVLASAPTALLIVTSMPDGAHLVVDGTDQGTTPATLHLAPGPHDLTLQAAGAVAEQRHVDLDATGAALDVGLWHDHPTVQALQPALPGAAIADATFLADGRVGLVVSLPGDERQAWTLDPSHYSSVDRLGMVAPAAPLAIRPDGQVLAFLQPARQTDASSLNADRLAELWLAGLGDDQGHAAWSVDQPDEQLVDLAWAPDSQHLLLVGRQHPSLGMERTSLRWLDTATGAAQLLALLPSEVVPGSYVWRPDGHGLAFLVHTASLSAVCTLSDAGEFHYLGDLGHDGTAGPPVAPVAWGPDGQLVYAALKPPPPSASSNRLGLGSSPPVGLFIGDATGGPGQPFGSVEGLSPTWWPDGRPLLAGLPSDRGTGLRLRELDTQGQAQELVSIDVATPAATGYGLRWDLAHQRALLVTNHSGFDGGHDYALLDFGWSDAD
jgi:hypothetical protein